VAALLPDGLYFYLWERIAPVEQHIDTRATQRGILLIALAGTLWGTVGVSTRAIYEMTTTNALSIGFFRLALAAPALLIASLALFRGRVWDIRLRDAAPALVIGAMLALYQVCFFTAIGYVGVAIATLVTLCSAPIMIGLIEAALTRAWPRGRMLAALGLALVGTMLLVGIGGDISPVATTAAATLTGIAFALGSAFGYAVVAVAGRRIAGRLDPLRTNALAFTSGAALLLLLAIPGGLTTSYPSAGWGLLLYLGLVPTALGYVLFMRGIRTTPSTAAGIITLVEPLTATLLAWAIFHEQLGQLGLVGAALLGVALWLVSQDERAEG
jgi:DME family drug/metabolite transporter